MKRKVQLLLIALVLFSAAVLTDCSSLKYRIKYQKSQALLYESIELHDRALTIIDSLEKEISKCQMKLDTLNRM